MSEAAEIFVCLFVFLMSHAIGASWPTMRELDALLRMICRFCHENRRPELSVVTCPTHSRTHIHTLIYICACEYI